MNITLPIQDISPHGIQFLATRKNNIIPGAIFTKLLYSNDIISTQGINITFPMIYDARTFFQANIYAMIQQISQLELNILYKYAHNNNCSSKNKQLHMSLTQLQNQILVKCLGRVPEDKENVYIMLKLSGVWETNDDIGITYIMRPVYVNPTYN